MSSFCAWPKANTAVGKTTRMLYWFWTQTNKFKGLNNVSKANERKSLQLCDEKTTTGECMVENSLQYTLHSSYIISITSFM